MDISQSPADFPMSSSINLSANFQSSSDTNGLYKSFVNEDTYFAILSIQNIFPAVG